VLMKESGKRSSGRSVGLVTYAGLVELDAGDALLRDALRGRGLNVRAVAWDDPAVDWVALGLCVIRSTWDYHHRLDEFLAWAEQVSELTSLWNPLEVVRWNTHKSYLRDLEERGVPVVPTEWFEKGEAVDLVGLMQERGWGRAVVKPSVSASAHGTVLVTGKSLAEGQAHLDRLLAERDVMVQPFMPSVETYRERSLLFMDGAFTHAVSRPPQLSVAPEGIPDEKRYEHGLVTAKADELELAELALRAAGFETLYARVDLVRDEAGTPRLIELELVEPSLFLRLFPKAAEVLAEAIVAHIA
jgi:hypothetical protein